MTLQYLALKKNPKTASVSSLSSNHRVTWLRAGLDANLTTHLTPNLTSIGRLSAALQETDLSPVLLPCYLWPALGYLKLFGRIAHTGGRKFQLFVVLRC